MEVTQKQVVLRMMHLGIQLRGSNPAVIGEPQPCGRHEFRTQGHRLSFPRRPCQGQGKSKVDTTEKFVMIWPNLNVKLHRSLNAGCFYESLL